MTRVKVKCSSCYAESEVSPAKIKLIAKDQSLTSGWYSFTCEECGQHVRKSANAMIIDLLTSAGIRARIKKPKPEEPYVPPITWDDILDFHLELEDDDKVAEWLAGKER